MAFELCTVINYLLLKLVGVGVLSFSTKRVLSQTINIMHKASEHIAYGRPNSLLWAEAEKGD